MPSYFEFALDLFYALLSIAILLFACVFLFTCTVSAGSTFCVNNNDGASMAELLTGCVCGTLCPDGRNERYAFCRTSSSYFCN